MDLLEFKEKKYQEVADWSKSVVDSLRYNIMRGEEKLKFHKLEDTSNERLCAIISPFSGLVRKEDIKTLLYDNEGLNWSAVGEKLENLEYEVYNYAFCGNLPISIDAFSYECQEILEKSGVYLYLNPNVDKTDDNTDNQSNRRKCSVYYMQKSIFPENKKLKELTKHDSVDELSIYGYVLILEEKRGE